MLRVYVPLGILDSSMFFQFWWFEKSSWATSLWVIKLNWDGVFAVVISRFVDARFHLWRKRYITICQMSGAVSWFWSKESVFSFARFSVWLTVHDSLWRSVDFRLSRSLMSLFALSHIQTTFSSGAVWHSCRIACPNLEGAWHSLTACIMYDPWLLLLILSRAPVTTDRSDFSGCGSASVDFHKPQKFYRSVAKKLDRNSQQSVESIKQIHEWRLFAENEEISESYH